MSLLVTELKKLGMPAGAKLIKNKHHDHYVVFADQPKIRLMLVGANEEKKIAVQVQLMRLMDLGRCWDLVYSTSLLEKESAWDYTDAAGAMTKIKEVTTLVTSGQLKAENLKPFFGL